MTAAIREAEVVSDGHRLAARIAAPEVRPTSGARPGLVLCHGFPARDPRAAPDRTYEHLALRIADALGWTVLALSFRGCGESEGSFSLAGWVRDLRAAVAHMIEEEAVDGVWVAGSATGASIALVAAGDDPTVNGVVTMAARADFAEWASHPRRLLEEARGLGLLAANEPRDVDAWSREFRTVEPLEGARRLGNRALFVLHGEADRRVPVDHARRIVEAHGAASFRVIAAASHRLRLDPRAVAMVLGWLDEQALTLGGSRAPITPR